MAYSSKKVFFHGVIGILAATVIIAAMFSSSIIFPNMLSFVEANTGTLEIKLTDAPVHDLQHLNLTINKVEVENETGSWVEVTILDGVAYFDLLKLENVTMDLSIEEMPIGNYTKIRMQIISANATLADNSTIPLNIPPGHIDINISFEINSGETTNLLIDIIVDKIKIAERGNSGNPANLNPQFKALVV